METDVESDSIFPFFLLISLLSSLLLGEAIYGSRIWNVAQSENFTVGEETIVTFYTTNKTLGVG